jgi:phenylpropionate dioxygenase-like ring-hydroxylating dioxygenase large terminal subunit
MTRIVTQPFPHRPTSVDDLLETGLLDHWYMVAPAADVSDRPLALKRLGRNLVLWRDGDGKVNVVEDYCPHRGAPLSLGYVCDGFITCAYHGVQVDGAGIIRSTPPTPTAPFIGQKALQAYSVCERHGAIWVYFASVGADAAPPEPVFPEEVSSPEWSSFLFTTTWKTNWQVALDNRLDPIHGSFLHTNTFTLGQGRKDAELKMARTPQGFETSRTNQRGVNIDWHEVMHFPDNILWVRTQIPYPYNVGGNFFRINSHPTPIDRDHTFVWFYRSSKVSGWRRDMWRFLYRNRLEARSLEVVEQDRAVLEAIPLDARRRELLLQTDVAVVRMRRLIRELAEAQFRKIEMQDRAAAH